MWENPSLYCSKCTIWRAELVDEKEVNEKVEELFGLSPLKCPTPK